MGSGDKTPRLKRPTPKPERATCPFCRKPIEVTVAGRLRLHAVTGKWARSMCRGSGEIVRSTK